MIDGYSSPEVSLHKIDHILKTYTQNTSSKLLISSSEMFHFKYKQLVLAL